MALLSQVGRPSSVHCLRSEKMNPAGSSNVEASKMKEARTSFLALPSKSTRKMRSSLHVDVPGEGYSKRGRRQHTVVAASPPTEAPVLIATEPLTKEDLVRHLASGCKPKEKWRIGTEHEKFGFELGSLRPMSYEQIAQLLNGIAERFDWERIMEGGNIIGLRQGKQIISLEPGGQFELSGAPVETLHQTCAEVHSHLCQVKAVTEEMGIGFLGIGFQPKWSNKEIPMMPKGRYEIIRNYVPKVGSLGLDVMFRTCTVQIATALFANSPFSEGKPNGYLSIRSQTWTDYDNKRTGMLPFVFDDSFGIGTEHEKFGFELGSLRPMSYEQIAQLLNGIAERFDWERIMEGGNIIGLRQGKQIISLEPGGQFELSGAPVETLHQTCAEVHSHLCQVKAVTEEMGIGFLGIGFHPKWSNKDIPMMPKGRYEIIRNYIPKVGSLGLDAMFRTCTVQVNLDFSSEADMIRKFRAGLALQPIATALFANSPFTEGKPNGYLSIRSHTWTDYDNSRTGMLPFVFDDSFGFEQYADYALDVPMFLVYRKHKYIDCSGLSFRDFMSGKLAPIPGELPTLNDWENHLTTIFPEVRLKTYLEMRGADVGPLRRICALPAFWVGILYDEVSLEKVIDMIADWTPEEMQMLRHKVPKTGLKTPFRDRLLKHVAEDVVKLAKDGLERRGLEETGFLNEVVEVVRTGETPAEKLLEMYHGKWGQSVDPVYEELLY